MAEYYYEQILRTMENDYLRGDKLTYPTALNKAYELATNWRGPGLKKNHGLPRQYEVGNTFVQNGEYRNKHNNNNYNKKHKNNVNRKTPGAQRLKDPNRKIAALPKRIVCFRCWGTGHKAQDCTTPPHNENQLTTTGSAARSDTSSGASNHHIFTTFGEEDDDSYVRYEMEGVRFGDDNPRPIRSTWVPRAHLSHGVRCNNKNTRWQARGSTTISAL